MFVYEKNGAINITFVDNKPVENPEYVIVVNKDAGTLEVNGNIIAVSANDPTQEVEDNVENTISEDPVEEDTPEDIVED